MRYATTALLGFVGGGGALLALQFLARVPATPTGQLTGYALCQGLFAGWRVEGETLSIGLVIREHGDWHPMRCIMRYRQDEPPAPTPPLGEGIVLFVTDTGYYSAWVPDAQAGTPEGERRWRRENLRNHTKEVAP